MAALVSSGMKAGAVGFSAGRLLEHSSRSGGRVPGTMTDNDELIALARAMGESGRGVFQLVPKGAVGSAMGADQLGGNGRMVEHSLFEDISRAAGRPLTYSLAELESDPDDIRQMVEASDRANENGVAIHPQIAARGIGGFNMLGAYHAFVMRPSYREIAHLPLAELVKAMREPSRRAAILSEQDVPGEFEKEPLVLPMLKRLVANLAKTFILESDIDFEPGPERRVGALAAAAGKTAEEYIYDHYTRSDGRDYNVSLVLNYNDCNLDHVYDLFERDYVVSGLGDGGAHVKSVCDSSMTTFQLAYWTRDRKRGPRLPLERMVKKLTSELAGLYGFDDRGVVAVGKRADLNVLDYDRLTIQRPYVANDLPSGAARILQGSEGYLATIVAGETTRRNDIETGARPGRLARSGRANQ
jgi:N-acyl-D-aspartate/D-glutamate deacylase